MVFNSIEFLIFLPVVFIIYWLIPKRCRWFILLIASYVFYMYWNWKLVFLILFTTIISYFSAIFLNKYKEKPKIQKFILILGLLLCFGVLLFFKYFPFLADVYFDIVNILGGKKINGYFDIMLPVGISFYTFQTASYIIDVYKRKIEPEKHFGYYALFVTFFPQLVAGPIERPQDLLPQLKNKETSIKNINYSEAFRIILIGFFKKIAIADIIGIYVNNVYGNLNSATGFSVLLATLLFAVQILCDFSGYSDIAVGCAKLFGINLTENFDSPYSSKSIKEFWGKWHISLSRWLRDYIYFPLGGSRCKKVRWIVNVLIVFFISGLWHGANYTFIVWGLLHGIFQIVGVLTCAFRNNVWKKIHIDPSGKFVTITRIICTFLLVDFCWIFFRATSINDACLAIAKLFTEWSFNNSYFKTSLAQLGITSVAIFYILFVLLCLIFVDRLKYLKENKYSIFGNSIVRFSSYLILAWSVIHAWIFLQASQIGSSFIYFQF